jgi:hypothetical protein
MGKHGSRHITKKPEEKPLTEAISPALNSPAPPATEPAPEVPAPEGRLPLALLVWAGGFLFLFLMMLFDLLFGLFRG